MNNLNDTNESNIPKEIKCPCCGELINPENLSKKIEVDEQELVKTLNDLNIEFG